MILPDPGSHSFSEGDIPTIHKQITENVILPAHVEKVVDQKAYDEEITYCTGCAPLNKTEI